MSPRPKAAYASRIIASFGCAILSSPFSVIVAEPQAGARAAPACWRGSPERQMELRSGRSFGSPEMGAMVEDANGTGGLDPRCGRRSHQTCVAGAGYASGLVPCTIMVLLP